MIVWGFPCESRSLPGFKFKKASPIFCKSMRLFFTQHVKLDKTSMKTLKNTLIIFLFLIFLASCALTNEITPLSYQPDVTNVQNVHVNTPLLSVAEFTDSRGVSNSRLIAHKINMNENEASGMYLAEMPITEILTESAKTALSDVGYKISDKGKYVLRGNLLRLDFKPIVGFWKGRLQGNVQVEFSLIDKRSGSLVWMQTYRGFADIDSIEYRQILKVAFDNLFTNLLSSSEFKDALR